MLPDFQRSVLQFIARETIEAKRRLHVTNNVSDQIDVAAYYAFALYQDLRARGCSISFSRITLENRGVPPADPEFFRHLHALEDFVALATFAMHQESQG